MSELYRSVLFMPGSNPRVIEKARTLDVDVIVFDLEDATAPEAKETARGLVSEALKDGAFGNSKLVVRINGLATRWWQDDIAAIGALNPEAIIVPKINDANDVSIIMDAMNKAGANDTNLWAMLETPIAFLNAGQIAGSSDRLQALVVGTNDLVKDLRARHVPNRESVITALGTAVLAARAYGLLVIDGVYNDFMDDEGLRLHALQARDMGYDGKSLIHPSQVAITNEVFSPSHDEIADAKALITAYKEAKVLNKGVATFKGKMIEELHVVEAERILDVANTLGIG
ncbi:CoA ester lyase [Kordiimonas sp. SCSIO 12610]|uniref:HpcH/HpaI aldolase/citrate lyase family protein n=1 Tax=Kordiimonas sp. SCSIO 12610 TaxID=2829597 RepID=UPI0021090DAC|nr:CoA ester lyase [Kordiimonas sp. SCSIO 12610]UTW55046.1 CoA ester lyase [Kordiimonas sp. SCSIO 12610]